MTAAPAEIACPLCGSRFDPAAAAACASCPLGARCSLVCCPSCGYGTVGAEGSALVGAAQRLRRRLRRRRAPAAGATLATCPAGSRVRIEAVDAVPEPQRDRLAAYGVAPGRTVEVLQTAPVTVVRCEHTELAFEPGIARAVAVVWEPA